MANSLSPSSVLRSFGDITSLDLQNVVNDIDSDEDTLIINSPYIDTSNLGPFLKKITTNFSVLDVNIQSLNAKFDSLLALLQELKFMDFEFDAICIQETWITGCPPDFSLFSIPGYVTIPLSASISTHSGLVIYLHKRHQYSIRAFDFNSNIWEGLFIDVFGQHIKKKITLCNIYRRPRDQLINKFLNDIKPILNTLGQERSDILIAGDFNIDLLQVNNKSKYGYFLDLLLTNGFCPSISLPSRVQQSATLIDNIFYKKGSPSTEVSSGIILSQLSDHFPCFTCINQNIVSEKPPKFKQIQIQSETAINNFVSEISNYNFLEKLDLSDNGDPNTNYKTLEALITEIKNKHLPYKTVKVHKHKHKLCPWISKGIIQSIKFRDNLYKRLKYTEVGSAEYCTLKTNLQSYNRILKKSIRTAKSMYYHNKFNQYKHDIKKTWNTINTILSRKTSKHKYPSTFNLGNDILTEKADIANQFNSFFTSIGPNFANNIESPPNKSFRDYLKRRPNTTFSFQSISPSDVVKTISKLASKTSTGHDNVSTCLLKRISLPLSVPLATIINQSFATGIFPDNLKLAKVIPIYKKEDPSLFDNYRPISLLPSISKVFERLAYNQVFYYLVSNNLIYCSQHGFREQHSTETATL